MRLPNSRRCHHWYSVEQLESRRYLAAVTLTVDPAQSKLSIAESGITESSDDFADPAESVYSGTVDADITSDAIAFTGTSLKAATTTKMKGTISGSGFSISNLGLQLNITGDEELSEGTFSTRGLDVEFAAGEASFAWDDAPDAPTSVGLTGLSRPMFPLELAGYVSKNGPDVKVSTFVTVRFTVDLDIPATGDHPATTAQYLLRLDGYIISNGQIFTGTGQVSGKVFEDLNRNGTRDDGEAGLPGRFIYADKNNDNIYQTTEPKAITDAEGSYNFNPLAAANYTIRYVAPANWIQTKPLENAGYPVTINEGNVIAERNFGTFSESSGGGGGGGGGTEAPEVAVFGNGFEISDGDTTPRGDDFTNFGTTTPNGEITRTFVVKNTGTAALTTSGLAITKLDGTESNAFKVIEGLSPSIAAGASDTITIRFKQEAASTYNRLLTFNSNDADESPYTFQLRATVSAPVVKLPEVAVFGKDKEIASGDTTPSTLDGTHFGGTKKGGVLTQTFVIRNTGTATLNTSNLKITKLDGSSTTAFKILEGLSASIAPGASDTITIRFTQPTAGTYTRLLSFATNDSNENPYKFVIRAEVA